ncbi:NADPH-dependent aldehyde reductase Ari1p [Trichomonascus vanleenenianus]|uniref:NADPH-dependent aldehyde reductase Ari1p n=1 Tax=Trichomonascus vanleenenianus TaxID=2268995 RepID=UPI003ECA18AC
MGKVLLTGASGFLGLHILAELLKQNHDVVATIRSERKLQDLQKVAEGKQSKLAVEFADNNDPHAYVEVFRKHHDIMAVIHTASPFVLDASDAKKEAIDPAVNGTVNTLKAANIYGKNVRKVVITSSIVANVDGDGYNPSYVYTEKDWAKVTIEQAVRNRKTDAYFASKKFAELAAWEFMKENKPHFSLTTILPPYIWGPVLGSLNSPDDLNESNTYIYSLLKSYITQSSRGGYVDARDVAAIHVNAIANPESENKRWYAMAGQFIGYDIVEIVTNSMDQKYKAGMDAELDDSVDIEDIRSESVKIDRSASNAEHGQNYKSLDTTILDTIQSFIDAGIY